MLILRRSDKKGIFLAMLRFFQSQLETLNFFGRLIPCMNIAFSFCFLEHRAFDLASLMCLST